MSILFGNNGDNELDGTDRGDLVLAGNGDNTVNAGGGNDVVISGRGDDTVNAGDGDDLVISGGGDDTVNAGDGDDLVISGRGDDTVDAGDGNDVVISGRGDDTVAAGDGDDLVLAGKGDDDVDAGAGNDIVLAGGGNDTVTHVESENTDSQDFYDGGRGQDTLRLIVTQSTFDSAAFQDELATFQALIDQNGSASGSFSSLGIQFRSFESIEVIIEDDGNQPPNVNVTDPAADTEGDEGESDIVTLSVADFVTIDDPDPDDTPVPYAGDLALQSTTGPEPDGGLGPLFSVDQATGTISYDRSDFDYLATGEEVTASFVFNASSGPDTLQLPLMVTIQGENDAPVVSIVDGGTTDEDAQPVQVDLLATASDVDATDTLSVQSIVATDDLGNPVAVGDNGDGTIAINPGQFDALGVGESRTVTVTYEVFDGTTAVANTATLLVEGRNDAPVVSIVDAGTTDEDAQPVQVDLLATASDVDANDTLSVQSIVATDDLGNPVAVGNPVGGLIDIDPGQFNALGVGESRTVTVTYEVFDGTTAVANTATLLVEGRNDAPVVTVIDAGTTDEDAAPVQIDLLATASDVDANDTLSVQAIVATDDLGNPVAVGNPIGGLIDIDPGQFNDLGVGESRTVTVTYEVFDGTTAVANTATVLVEGRNDAPVVSIVDGGTTDEDAAPVQVDLLATASDVDASDTLSVQAIVATDDLGNPVGFANNSDGTIDIDPGQFDALGVGESRTVTVTYEVFDGTTAVANTATLLVEGRNDAPLGEDGVGEAIEDTALNGSLPAASDVDGDTITYGPGTTDAQNGLVTIDPNGTFTYQPALDFNGSDTFSYVISDGNGGEEEYLFTVVVTGVNDAPVVVDQTFSIAEESVSGSQIGALQASDVDSVDLQYAILDGNEAGLFAIDELSGVITLAQTVDDAEVDDYALTVGVSDGVNPPSTAIVTVQITPVNDAPVVGAAIADQVATEEQEFSFQIPADAFSDIDSNIQLTATRADGSPLPAWLAFDGASFTGTPDDDDGPISVKVTASDGEFTAEQIFNLDVVPVNDAPVAVDDDFETEETAPLSGNVFSDNRNGEDSDVEGDALTVTAVDGDDLAVGAEITLASGALLQLNSDGTFDYDPNGAFSTLLTGEITTDSFSYTISDGNGGTDVADVTINIRGDFNAPPTTVNDLFSVLENRTAIIAPLANDIDDGDEALTIVAIDGQSIIPGASITLADGATVLLNADNTLTYDPNGAFDVGPNDMFVVDFSYDVEDASGNRSTGQINGNILGSSAPITQSDLVEVLENETVTFDPLANDTDPENDTLTLIRIDGSEIAPGQTVDVLFGGQVTLNLDGTVTFDPNGDFAPEPGQETVVSLPYEITDGAGNFVSGLANVRILPNEAPLTTNDTFSLVEGGTTIIDLLGNDSDPEGDDFQLVNINGIPISETDDVVLFGAATVSLNPDGSVTVTADPQLSVEPGAPFQGDFTYEVQDSAGNAAIGFAQYEIIADEPPIVGDDAITVADSTTVTFDPLANDSDPEGGALTIESIGGQPASAGDQVLLASGALVTFNPDGTLTYDPVGAIDPLPGETFVDQFEYFAEDTFGNKTQGAILVSVTHNDAPVVVDDAITVVTGETVTSDILSNDSDANGDQLTITRIDGQDISIGQTITLNNGALVTLNADQSITYNPNGVFNLAPGAPDQQVISYEVSDGQGRESQGIAVVTVREPNVAPTLAGPLSATVTEGGTFAITEGELSFDDPDNDTVTFTATDIVNGTLLVNGVEQSTFTSADLANPGIVQFVHDGSETLSAGFTVSVEDDDEDGSPPDTATFNFDVTPVNDAPTVTLENLTTNLSEDADTSGRIKVADIVVTDPDTGTNPLNLVGEDAALFEIDGSELFLIADAELDFETNPVLDVTVEVDDVNVGPIPDDSASLSITLGDVNEAPTVSLANPVTELPDGTDTSAPIKVADIVVSDDVLGTNDLTLSGADAALFEIEGMGLFLRAGANLDSVTNPSLDVTVEVDDATLTGAPDDSVSLSIVVAEAPSLLVTTTEDVVDAFDGETSLREALAFANSVEDADGVDGSNDTITFATGIGEAFENGGTIFLGGNGQLVISSDVTIDGDVDGNGSPDVTINANSDANQDDATSRVFLISSGTSAFQGLEITGGEDETGGGVLVFSGAALSVENSEITGNSATLSGGGIATRGTLFLDGTTVSDNSAGLSGGGISADTFVGALTLNNTTISGNSSVGDGGGLASETDATTIINTTISGNTTASDGGGIHNRGVATLTNSLVLGNSGGETSGDPYTDNGGNLIGNGTIDVADVFAELDPDTGGGLLADNGGPVQTIALKADAANPAIDRGQPTALTSDANGNDRNVDVPGVDNGGTVDAGSVEVDDVPSEAGSLVVTITGDVVNRFDGETSLREAIAFANSTDDADNDGYANDTITFATGVGEAFENGGTIFLGGNGQLEISSDVTIDGDLDMDGNPDVVIDANSGAGLNNASGRVLLVSGGDSTLTGLTLTGGNSEFGSGGGIKIDAGATILIDDSEISGNESSIGGGIFNAGTLQVSQSLISGNTADRGGGLSNEGQANLTNVTIDRNDAAFGGGLSNSGTLQVSQSLMSENSADFEGGGVFNEGVANFTSTTIERNTALDGGGVLNEGQADFADTTIEDNQADFGGGLSNSGQANLIDTTIEGNQAASQGGGIFNVDRLDIGQSVISGNSGIDVGGGIFNGGQANLTNTTVEGNAANLGSGGGIATASPGVTTLTHVTVTGNSANSRGDGLYANGSPTIDVTNSIVVGNGDEDIDAPINDLGGNLFGGGSIDVADVFANVNTATGGGFLADNGGPVETVALKEDASNPALDRGTAPADTLDADGDGDTTEPLPIDAEGNARENDLPDADNGGTVDAGAVELFGPVLEAPSLVVTTTEDVVDDMDGVTSLREAIAFANSVDDADGFDGSNDTITFASGVEEAFANGGTIFLGGNGQLRITSDVTIDGDVNNDGVADVVVDANSSAGANDATGRVFLVSSGTSTLDGLTIKGGQTNSGGGINVQSAATLTVENSEIIENSSTGNGGGILNNGDLTVSNTEFSENSAGIAGGGLWTDSELTVTGATLSDNTAGRFGGGLTGFNSTITATETTISDNYSNQDGGGILVFGSTTNLVATTISGNSARVDGGGVHSFNSETILTNSTVSNNSAGADGGGVANINLNGFDAQPVTMVNTTVSGNTASNDGGGVFSQSSTTNIIHGTVSGNDAGGDGDGISYFDGGPGGTNLTNSLVLGNGTQEIDGGYNDNGGNLIGNGSIAVADVFAGVDPTTGGGLLADNGGPVETIRLKADATNPAIDLGTTAADVTDLDGDSDDTEDLPIDANGDIRDLDVADLDNGGIADAGAVEIQESDFELDSLIVTTTEDVVNSLDGETSLREALAFANSVEDADGDGSANDTITFANGVGEAFENGGTIYLGDNGELTVSSDVTIEGDLDGDGEFDVTLDANTAAGFDDATSRVLLIDGDGTTQLNGLKITGGQAGVGGGISFERGSTGALIVNNSKISGNSATENGGGLFSSAASPAAAGSTITLTNTTVSNNDARDGGGIFVQNSPMTVNNSTFSDNSARSDGGGIWIRSGTLDMTNATLVNNSAKDFGGALFSSEERSGFGGTSTSDGAEVSLVHTTIVANRATAADNDDDGGPIIEDPPRPGEPPRDPPDDPDPITNDGDGLYIEGGNLTVTNSLTFQNGALADQDDITGSYVNGGGNVIGSSPGLQSIFDFNTVQIVTIGDDRFYTANLSDNGGLVQTLALRDRDSNPAVDIGVVPLDVTDVDGDGDRSEALPIDANGNPRNVDLANYNNGGTTDAGAVELQTGSGGFPFAAASTPDGSIAGQDTTEDQSDWAFFIGEDGADEFVFENSDNGGASIENFQTGEDTLQLDGFDGLTFDLLDTNDDGILNVQDDGVGETSDGSLQILLDEFDVTLEFQGLNELRDNDFSFV